MGVYIREVPVDKSLASLFCHFENEIVVFTVCCERVNIESNEREESCSLLTKTSKARFGSSDVLDEI